MSLSTSTNYVIAKTCALNKYALDCNVIKVLGIEVSAVFSMAAVFSINCVIYDHTFDIRNECVYCIITILL
jgi:uncharacterized membrane protein